MRQPCGEVSGQRRDVVFPIAQRRQLDHHDVDPVEQVLTKRPCADLGLEVARRRGEDSRIHPTRLLVANSPDFTLLQDAQQLCLQSERQLADFVQEDRSAVGGFEEARLVRARPGEGAAHVAEQLGLEQRLRNRCAVDANERLTRARARAVNRARNNFLPSAALTRDQDGGIVLGDAGDELERLAHRGACDDEPALRRSRRELCLEAGDLLPQPFALLCLPQCEDDFVRAERLGEIVVRAFLHRRDRRILPAVRAHDDDERTAAALAVFAQERQTVHFRHANVAEHEVECLGDGAVERPPPVLLGRHRVARIRQEESETLPQARFVIDDEDLLHRGTAMGKNILNAAPPSRAPSTQTTPPISCTDRATMARPRPVPRPGSLVV